MKKMLLKCLSALTLIVATSTAFAAPTYNTSVLSTSEALASRTALKTANAANSVSTDIIVVNYTNTDVVLAEPQPARLITQRTSGRIMSPGYGGYSRVVLTTPQGGLIWASNTVGPFDTLSVYISGGQYVVYDTAN